MLGESCTAYIRVRLAEVRPQAELGLTGSNTAPPLLEQQCLPDVLTLSFHCLSTACSLSFHSQVLAGQQKLLQRTQTAEPGSPGRLRSVLGRCPVEPGGCTAFRSDSNSNALTHPAHRRSLSLLCLTLFLF